MNKKKITHLEILFAFIIVIAIILVNLIGTTTISDDSVNVNEDGFPTTDKTFDDFKAPGTRFGIMTGTDWGMEVAKRYPEAEIFQYATAHIGSTTISFGRYSYLQLGYCPSYCLSCIMKGHRSGLCGSWIFTSVGQSASQSSFAAFVLRRLNLSVRVIPSRLNRQ